MTGGTGRILIVDDEVTVCNSLSRYLEEFGYHTVTAESAEAALELMAGQEFDLAVVDIRLPGISGDAFISRAHGERPGMRFLIHTGSAEYELPRELRRIGMDNEHVFQKPLPDLDVLRRAVDRILNP